LLDGIGDGRIGGGRLVNDPRRRLRRRGFDLPAVPIPEGHLDPEKLAEAFAQGREGAVGQEIVDRDGLTGRNRELVQRGLVIRHRIGGRGCCHWLSVIDSGCFCQRPELYASAQPPIDLGSGL